MNSQTRYKELDGLRAFAVLIVIAGHALLGFYDTKYADIAVLLAKYLLNAENGVQLFFVLSGFIITLRLIQERESNGQVSLSRFYFRRFFKLFPPLLPLIALVWVLTHYWRTGLTLTPGCVSSALTFTVGVFKNCRWDLSHLWSLTCEEIFYFVWPILFVRAYRRFSSPLALLGIILGVAFGRILLYKFSLPPLFHSVLSVLIYIDHMAFGAALAILYSGKRQKLGECFWSIPFPVTFAVVIFWGTTFFSQTPFIRMFLLPFGPTLKAFAVMLTILAILKQSETPFKKLLRQKWLRWIGLASYSIYLYQQPLVNTYYLRPLTENPFLIAALGGFLALSVGGLAYMLVERPLLYWRHRVERFILLSPKSPPLPQ